MKKQFIRCEFCNQETITESCHLAAYSTEIDGREYVFCCQSCAERYKAAKKEE